MPVPGYDPEDLDDALKRDVDDDELRGMVTDDQWERYQRGDAELVDILDEEEIDRLLEERTESTD